MSINEVSVTPSARGKGFDIVSPQGTDWALTREAAEDWANIRRNGLRRDDYTAEEWAHIQGRRA